MRLCRDRAQKKKLITEEMVWCSRMAAEAGSGSEHVFTASVKRWCQNIRERWNERKEVKKENG